MSKPFLPDELKAKIRTFRMNDINYAKLKLLGGAKWIHAQLAKVK